MSAATAWRSRRTYAPMARFSCTVRWGKTRRPSGQCAIPDFKMVAGSRFWISRPSKTMRPALGRSRPEIARSVDDLPAPLAPIKQTSSPDATARSIPRSAVTGPYAAATLSIFSTAGSEVCADDVGVRLHDRGCPLRDDRAVIEHDHGIAQPHDDSHVVLYEQPRDATIADRPDEAADPVFLGARHPGRRRVEEQDRRASGQRHPELDEALLAVRQSARDVPTPVSEADERHDGLGLSTKRRLFSAHSPAGGEHGPHLGAPAEVEAGQHVVEHAQRRKDACLLERPDHAPARDVAGTEARQDGVAVADAAARSEEHTSELQSPCNLVCRLLLEKKKKHSNVIRELSER